MEGPVHLTIVSNELEAELVCGLLRADGLRCMHRITDMGFGAGGEIAASGAGAREVLVLPSQLADARAILASVDGAAGT